MNSLLSLMLVSTVFRCGFSSSAISSTPRTLIAPNALFRLSVGRKLRYIRSHKLGHRWRLYGSIGNMNIITVR